MGFVEKYRRAFRELGLVLKEDDGIDTPSAAVEAGDAVLPLALEDYYAACGLHEVNRRQNVLLPPDELSIVDDWLVFMQEEQGGIVWGVQATGEADPDVWQGVSVDGDPDYHWYSEELLLSDFIPAMWRWQITSEEPQRDAPG